MRFVRLIQRPVRVPGRTCGPRRLQPARLPRRVIRADAGDATLACHQDTDGPRQPRPPCTPPATAQPTGAGSFAAVGLFDPVPATPAAPPAQGWRREPKRRCRPSRSQGAWSSSAVTICAAASLARAARQTASHGSRCGRTARPARRARPPASPRRRPGRAAPPASRCRPTRHRHPTATARAR
jgi:hypothetical protein